MIGGVVVDGGTFDWANAPRFKEDFVDPDPSYHGVSYAAAFGPLAFILKLRVQGLRDLGAALSPFNAWQLIQGLETLPLRIERHSENALAVAQWLQDRPEVEWVSYPGLASHASHEIAKRTLTGGFGGLVTFGIKGGADAGRKLIDSVKLFSLLANVGDAKSLDHPPGQHDPPAADRRRAGLHGRDRRTSSACPSASSTSTTSSPTSTRPSALRPRPRPSRSPPGRRAMAPDDTRVPGGTVLPGARPPARDSARLPLGTGRLETADLGAFALEGGATLPLTIAYRHDGPGPDAPQVLVIHALTGSADAAGDWWAPLIGPGRAFDTDAGRRPVREPAGRPLRVHRADLGQPRDR